ncbi:MAG TPA: biotin/lipoyl-containing protein [Candidatus Eisenbacteria bacterium]
MKATYVVQAGNRRVTVDIREVGDRYELTIDGTTHVVDSRRVGRTAVRSLIIAGKSYEANTVQDGDKCDVYLNGDLFSLEVFDELWARAKEGKSDGAARGETIQAPIPGAVVKLMVEAGQVVAAGQPVAVLEAMKMQNELTATWGGTVTDVKVKLGDTVAAGAALIVVAPPVAEAAAAGN